LKQPEVKPSVGFFSLITNFFSTKAVEEPATIPVTEGEAEGTNAKEEFKEF